RYGAGSPSRNASTRRYRHAERSRALRASTSLSLGGIAVSRPASNRAVAAATASTAAANAASLARDGLWNPLTFRTYWSAAARTSASVAGGSKLKSGLMLRHMGDLLAASSNWARDRRQ